MHPKWRAKLSKHRGKVLGEFQRTKMDGISGVVLDYSDELLLLMTLEWDTFSFNGYSIIRDSDLSEHRFFSDKSDWRNQAISKKYPETLSAPKIVLANWKEAINSIKIQFPVLGILQEITKPDVCFIGCPKNVSDKTVVLADLDYEGEWSKSRIIRLSQITRIDFGDGYQKALSESSPRPRCSD